MLLLVLSVGQHVTNQNRLVIIEDLGYQSEIVATNIEHRVDPLLTTFSHVNAIRHLQLYRRRMKMRDAVYPERDA